MNIADDIIDGGIFSLTSHVGYALSQWRFMTIKAATSKTELKQTSIFDNRFVSLKLPPPYYTLLSRQRRGLWEKPHIVQSPNLSWL